MFASSAAPVLSRKPAMPGSVSVKWNHLKIAKAMIANILIFERLKEELRNGRNLVQAIDQAWDRAWPSIWESNTTTLITSLILYWFGSTFGATIVKGFSLTLALGVGVSLFTAIYVTRS